MIKKIFKPIISLFMFLYKLLDKFIVVPLSRLVYRINELSRNNSGRFEKFLNRPNVLIYVSLTLAIIVFLLIDSKTISLVSNEAIVLAEQPINVTYNEEAYVVEGVPSTVDITLIGRKSDLYLAKQLGEHEVSLDLRNYSVGTYKVKLSYNHNIDSIDYKLDPGTLTVKISKKESTKKAITYELLNEDKLDSKLSIKNIVLDRNEVVVKGSEEALSKVAKVKALLDLKAADLTEKGTFTVDSIVLAAYTSNGTIINNVEIVPAKISASVTVDSYFAELPVKVITEGTLTTGYAMSSATSSVTKVGVYGDEETIKSLQYIEAKINVNGLNSNKTFSVSLTKPSGVRYMTENSTNIDVKLETETSKEFEGIQIAYLNLGNGYSAGALSESDRTITVIAKGVTSVLNNLSEKNITAEIDLSGYTAGTFDVPVKVKTDDVRVSLVAKTTTIKVKISAKG